ncbi:MAG: Amuc_1099 family pilus-like system protein [Verrucomicrobiales bacterium]
MKKPSESRKTDRIIVIASAVVGLGLATWAILKSNSFSGEFSSLPPANPNKGKDLIEKATKLVEDTKVATAALGSPKPVKWSPAAAAGRDRGYLVSTNLVFRKGADESSDAIIDLDRAEPLLREAFPNSFWLENPGLNLEAPNVGDLDPDKDYFTTLEEYEMGEKMGKKFNPQDPKSHPPMHFRLRFVSFEEAPYKLKFTSSNPPEFTLRHENDNRELRWSDTAALPEDANGNGQLDEGEDANFNGTLDGARPAGKKNDEGRFAVLSVEKVKVAQEGLPPEEVNRITVEDSTRPKDHPQRKFQVSEGETITLLTKVAVFDYLPKPGAPISKREYEKFILPDTLAPSYTLKEVDAEKAIVDCEEGGQTQTLTFERGKDLAP